jgi:hypothetical protein
MKKKKKKKKKKEKERKKERRERNIYRPLILKLWSYSSGSARYNFLYP